MFDRGKVEKINYVSDTTPIFNINFSQGAPIDHMPVLKNQLRYWQLPEEQDVPIKKLIEESFI